jgi:CBS domain-containing protein
MKARKLKKVRDVMSKDVLTVRPDTTVQEIARLVTEHHLRILPVVDDDGRIVGMVSESDLFLKEKGIPFSAVKIPFLFERWVDPKQLAEIYESARHHTAADVMTTDLVCVDSNDTVGHAALLMMRHDLLALPVVQEDKLLGLISRLDFVRILAEAE